MIISEIGLNHLGDYELAYHYVNQLLATDVDAITFQIREPEFYAGQFKNFKLTSTEYKSLKMRVNNSGKLFGYAISDIPNFDELDADFFKILSKDLDNLSFVEKLTEHVKDKPIYFSTGMSGLDVIQNTIDACEKQGFQDYRLIHTRLSNCIDEVNLKAINNMKNEFGNIVAFGNHCENTNVLYTAVAYEPTDYYFYVKNKKQNYHPDDLHAIYLDDVQTYCSNINELIKSLGSGDKTNTNNTIKGQI